MKIDLSIEQKGIIVAKEAIYDEDKKLYGTYIGLNNKNKSLLFTVWGSNQYVSIDRANWLKSQLVFPERVGIELTTNIIFEKRVHVVAVYKIQFDNGYYYIGSTKNLKSRYDHHKSQFSTIKPKSILAKRALEVGVKSGELSIIQSFTNREECFECEKRIITENVKDQLMLNMKDYCIRSENWKSIKKRNSIP